MADIIEIQNAPKDLNLTSCFVSSDGGVTKVSLLEIKESADIATEKVIELEGEIPSPIDTSKFIQKSDVNVADGVLGLTSANEVVFPISTVKQSWVRSGMDLKGVKNATFVRTGYEYFVGGIASPYQEMYQSPDGKSVQKQIWGSCIYPSNINFTDLGKPNLPFNNIYVSNQPIVTSDINSKNVIANDISKSDYAKLLDAVFSVSASLYTMKIVVEEKGEDAARIHSGFIAQELEAAMIAQGLNPSLFAFWCKFPVYENIFTTKKDENGNEYRDTEYVATKDEDGNQLYAQALRYDELFALLVEALKVKMSDFETRLAALETK